jgi:hypothetical protein
MLGHGSSCRPVHTWHEVLLLQQLHHLHAAQAAILACSLLKGGSHCAWLLAQQAAH